MYGDTSGGKKASKKPAGEPSEKKEEVEMPYYDNLSQE